MKVAIIADPIDNQWGGIHVYTRELVSALSQSDLQHEFILIRTKRDPSIPFRQITIPLIRFGLIFIALRTFVVIPLLMRWHRVDAVMEPAHFGPFNLPRRIKRITMIHDLTPLRLPQYHPWHSQVLQRLFLNRILRKASLVLANSTNTKRDIIDLFPFCQGKTETIHLGLPAPFKIEASKTRKEAPLSERYFLVVGTIEPRKNLLRILEAYKAVRQKYEEKLSLVFVGKKGWKSNSFFSTLEDHPFRGDIHLKGYVSIEKLADYYHHAVCLLYPSEYEGFGFPVLEAYIFGCPVVCSQTSSLPEVGGDLAIYIDPYQVEELEEAMGRMLQKSQNWRDDFRIRASDWAQSFSWKSYVNKFQQLLTSD